MNDPRYYQLDPDGMYNEDADFFSDQEDWPDEDDYDRDYDTDD